MNSNYERISQNEEGHSTPQRMTKARALKLLDLKETATPTQIQEKFDQIIQSFTNNPLAHSNTLQEMQALVEAKNFLDAIHKYKLKSPVIAHIQRQNRQGKKAIDAYQKACDDYFFQYEKLLSNIDAANRKYLNISNLVGKDPKETYQAYQKEINAFFGKFIALPQLVDAQIIHNQVKALMAENVFANIVERGGPQKAISDELQRLSTQKMAVDSSLQVLETRFKDLESTVVDINQQFANAVDKTKTKEELDKLATRYTKAMREKVHAPIKEILGDAQNIAINLVEALMLNLEDVKKWHLRHIEFVEETEHTQDQRIKDFLDNYHNYIQTLDTVLSEYPDLQPEFEKLSNATYSLGAQYLLATLDPALDRTDLTKTLHTAIENLVLKINRDFKNKDDEHATKKDKDWAAAWEKIAPSFTNLFAEIHQSKTLSADPTEVFQQEYNSYLIDFIATEKKITIPEHQAIFKALRTRMNEIGETFFAAVKEPNADVKKLSEDYHQQFVAALNDADNKMQEAGMEQTEIWPNLHPIIQALATVIYFVRYLIKAADEKIPERNRVFKSEKEEFQKGLTKWIDTIPQLNEDFATRNRDTMSRGNTH